jgi:hypothetical protein
VRELTAASREGRGYGFDLRRETTRNRVQGLNELPVAVVVPTEEDALRLIRRLREADSFRRVAEETVGRYPGLRDWLARRPLLVVEHASAWERILAVVDWFVAHPHSGLYLRQVDIPRVDTKFIEAHRSLLSELLDQVLPEGAVDRSAVGNRNFRQRFGLRAEPPLVRFRILDPALHIAGLCDISLPPEQFASLAPRWRRVFVTENRTNGLAFPDCADSAVVFGLGYGLDRLADAIWLKNMDIHYWGDIDTHGFGILNRLRATFPATRSFLMDRETLLRHQSFWVQEPPDMRYLGAPSLLTCSELELLEDLRQDRYGERVRLEQERVGYGWLCGSLEKLL